METSDILRKIGRHVVFAESQSGAFRTVITESILRITHYAIPQIINIPTANQMVNHLVNHLVKCVQPALRVAKPGFEGVQTRNPGLEISRSGLESIAIMP